jgi:hypothetical protein
MLLLSRWLGTGEVKLGKLEELGSAMAMDRNSASKLHQSFGADCRGW